MKRKKFALMLIAASIITVPFMNTIKVSAWSGGNSTSKINLDDNGGRRPTTGHFNSNATNMPDNPIHPYKNEWSLHLSDPGSKEDASHSMANGLSVKSAIAEDGYGGKILYYTINGGDVNPAVLPENQYAYMNRSEDISNWYRTDSYNSWTRGEHGQNNNFTKYGMRYNSIYYGDSYDKPNNARFLGYNAHGESLTNPGFGVEVDGSWDSHNVNSWSWALPTPATIANSDTTPKTINNNEYYDSPQFKPDKKVALIRTLNSMDKNVYLNGYDSIKDYVDKNINKISLRTDPTIETPVFYVEYAQGTYSTIIGVTDPKILADLVITKMEVYNSSGKLVGQYTRSGQEDNNGTEKIWESFVPGNKYTIKYTVHNYSSETTNLNPSKLDFGYAKNSSALNIDYSSHFSNNTGGNTLTSAQIPAGGDKVFETTFTIPNENITAWRFTGDISPEHASKGDDNNLNNNWAKVYGQVSYGDFVALEPYFEDESGNKVETMVPGKKYRAVYKYQYVGPNRDTKYDLSFTGTIVRTLPTTGSSYGKTETLKKDFNLQSQELKTNKIFTTKTDYYVFEIPKATLQGNVGSSLTTHINSDKSNDKNTKNYEHDYDISLTNLKVYPGNTNPTKDGSISVGISYDITYKTPNNVKVNTPIDTLITLPNGSSIKVTDIISNGTTTGLSHEINIPVTALTSGCKDYGFKAFANYNKVQWEKDIVTTDGSETQANNKDNTKMQICAPVDPTTPDGGTYTGGGKSNDSSTTVKISGGCPVDTVDSNTWTQDAVSKTFNSAISTYTTFDKTTTYGYYSNPSTSVTYKSKSQSYNESYKIDYVKFKSKYTTDKGYGTNGWVDLTKSSEKDLAKIKAGYGYELEIQVTYKTDAYKRFSSNMSNILSHPKVPNATNTKVSGEQMLNDIAKANLNTDIYVRTSDGKVYSAGGTAVPSSSAAKITNAFNSTIVKNTNSEVTVKYTMKTKNTSGLAEPTRIYVGEDTKDGEYSIRVYTPVQSGVGTVTNKAKLCDSLLLKYKVQGSMYDDNNEHTNQ